MRKLAIGVVVLAAAAPAMADGIFANSYNALMTFKDADPGTTMTLCFDGTNFWSGSGGGSGSPMAQYDAAGNFISNYTPNLDQRSLFTMNNTGAVFLRQFADPTIYKQTSPGVFAAALTLSGGSLDAQSAVVFTANGGFLAMQGGNVSLWDAAGNSTGGVGLSGWGSMFGEGVYPQDRGIADGVIAGNQEIYLTYSNGSLSGWDTSGNRIGTTTLNGAGTSFDSHFSISVADNKVWVVDEAGGLWRGYDVGLVPAPSSVGVLALAGIFAARRRR